MINKTKSLWVNLTKFQQVICVVFWTIWFFAPIIIATILFNIFNDTSDLMLMWLAIPNFLSDVWMYWILNIIKI